MDSLLLPLAEANEATEQHRQIIALTLTHAAPLARQMMRKWLNFQINAEGYDPYSQEAADLCQDILAKVLQTLNDKLEGNTLKRLRIFGSTSCELRRTPAATTKDNNPRFVRVSKIS